MHKQRQRWKWTRNTLIQPTATLSTTHIPLSWVKTESLFRWTLNIFIARCLHRKTLNPNGLKQKRRAYFCPYGCAFQCIYSLAGRCVVNTDYILCVSSAPLTYDPSKSVMLTHWNTVDHMSALYRLRTAPSVQWSATAQVRYNDLTIHFETSMNCHFQQGREAM